MNETEYASIISTYQQKSFELFNQNIVYQAQIASLQKQIAELTAKIQSMNEHHEQNHEQNHEHHHG